MEINSCQKQSKEKFGSDEELVVLFLKTKENAYFEELHKRHAKQVYKQCLNIVKDPERALDFTQDIFLKLVIKLASFRQEAKFVKWLFKIVYNHCMSHFREINRCSIVLMENSLEVADEDDFYKYLECDDSGLKDITTMLDDLNLQEKEILLMKYVDDMSVKDISEVLSIKQSAVKMRLLRCREKLKRNLQSESLYGV